MLIRHISIPKNTHLASLAQPKDKEQPEDLHQQLSYFTKTLNPEQPIVNMLTSPKEDKLIHSQRQEKNKLPEKLPAQNSLVKEEPQYIDQFEPDLLFSPKKQNYKYLRQVYQAEPARKINDPRQRILPLFSPQLNRNAYLRQDHYENIPNNNISNFQYLKEGEDQQQQVINKRHFNSLIKNKQVYRTLEKFKKKDKSELEDSRLRSHKKYTYQPIKNVSQVISAPQKVEKIQKQSDKKYKRLEPLSNKKEKPYVSNPSLHEKKRNLMPEDIDDDEISQPAIHFQRQKVKSSFVRKTSEEEKAPESKPQSQIYLINKHIAQRKQSRKDIGQLVLQVSYRTSLARLKEICTLSSIQKYNIIMKIPEIFAYPLFNGNQPQEQLFNKADEVLKHLQVPRKEISIKKYSNCVVIISGIMAVVWHYNGKVYLGGWKHQILDQGAKYGLGLQWVPKKYVYYGQFCKNKREGVGIMKTCENTIICGTWRQNQLIKPSIEAKESLTQVYDRTYE